MAVSILQIGISRNVDCDIMVGFPKSGHILDAHFIEASLSELHP